MPGKLHLIRDVPYFGETRKEITRLGIYHGRRRIGQASYKKVGPHVWKWVVWDRWGITQIGTGETKTAEVAKISIRRTALERWGLWG